ncbi:hypothetical protein LV779_31920 [Streptomyces thinghirensis]|nr:hypothetical protein [Streptomyces thinghirensis]
MADDPEMGRPSALPGILSVTVDGAVFEDCPDPTIGYIREPDRIQIRYVNAVPTADPATEAREQAGDRRVRPCLRRGRRTRNQRCLAPHHPLAPAQRPRSKAALRVPAWTHPPSLPWKGTSVWRYRRLRRPVVPDRR